MPVDLSSSTYVAILLLACLSIIATLIGVTLAIWIGRNDSILAAGIGFSAGIMLLISFFELLPEGFSKGGVLPALAAFALGMFLVAALHWLIPHTHLIRENGAFGPHAIRTAYLVAFGLILHDVPEGMAMANSYIHSPSLGILVALAIALHNIPEEFAMAAPIVAIRQKRFLYRAAFLSALAEPLGAVVGLVAANVQPALNSLFMVFAAGAMVFVSVHELLPLARTYQKTRQFIFGALASVLVYGLLGLGLGLD